MSHILALEGSPFVSPKALAVLEYAHQYLRRRSLCTNALSVRCLPAEALLPAQFGHPAIQDAVARVAQAEGIIVATPVFKASYSGILKAFLDMLPQNALRDKVVLPIATSNSPGHLLMLDYALKPVLSTLGANHILDGVYITDSQIQFAHGGVLQLDERCENRLEQSLEELVKATTRLSLASYSTDWVI